MICHQYEQASVKVLVELLQAIYDGQRFLVYLTVVSFCSSESLGHVGNWTLASIRIAMNQDCSNSNVGRVTSQYQSFVWIEVYQNLIRGQYILQLFKCCLLLIFPLPGCCLLCQAVERLCHAGQVRDELPVELYWAQERLQAWDVRRRWHLQNCLDLGSFGDPFSRQGVSKLFYTGLCELALITTTSESFVVQTSEQAFQVAQVVVGVLTADEHVVLEDGNSR